MSDYEIPTPSRMKLKETKAEKAHRLYRREQRKMWKEQQRIDRANGYGVSPPRAMREESMSPPRYGPRSGKRPFEDVEDEVNAARTYREDREEWAEKLAWLEAEELGRANDPFATFSMPGQRVPQRHQHGPAFASSSTPRRDAAHEVGLGMGGAVPPMGVMNDNEYAEWVREGMFRLRHQAEIQAAERARAARREKERRQEVEREQAEKEERRRIRQLEREKGQDEEKARQTERQTWRTRCAALAEGTGDVVSVNLKFSDVPWPVYTTTRSGSDVQLVLGIDDITLERVQLFLFGLADDDAKADGKGDSRRKVLRDAIRLFHPDRFYARVLPRVRDGDKERVKEGVEKCSRLINELLSKK